MGGFRGIEPPLVSRHPSGRGHRLTAVPSAIVPGDGQTVLEAPKAGQWALAAELARQLAEAT